MHPFATSGDPRNGAHRQDLAVFQKRGRTPGRPWRPHLAGPEQWLFAAGLFLAVLATWLEVASTPPAGGRLVFTFAVAAIAFICDAGPAAAAALSGGMAAWWFARHAAGMGLYADASDVAWIMPYASVTSGIVAASVANGRRAGQRGRE